MRGPSKNGTQGSGIEVWHISDYFHTSRVGSTASKKDRTPWERASSGYGAPQPAQPKQKPTQSHASHQVTSTPKSPAWASIASTGSG